MYELFALTAGEAFTLLLIVAAHGALIAFLVRHGWLATPRPTAVLAPAPRAARTPATPERPERRVA